MNSIRCIVLCAVTEIMLTDDNSTTYNASSKDKAFETARATTSETTTIL